jgi:hypothetical protein
MLHQHVEHSRSHSGVEYASQGETSRILQHTLGALSLTASHYYTGLAPMRLHWDTGSESGDNDFEVEGSQSETWYPSLSTPATEESHYINHLNEEAQLIGLDEATVDSPTRIDELRREQITFIRAMGLDVEDDYFDEPEDEPDSESLDSATGVDPDSSALPAFLRRALRLEGPLPNTHSTEGRLQSREKADSSRSCTCTNTEVSKRQFKYECPLCYESEENISSVPCGHVFCTSYVTFIVLCAHGRND